MSAALRPGPRNALADIPGLRVGHAETAGGAGGASGVTVVLCDSVMIAGVDVRGGGPATRETDALDPSRLVGAVHALTLSGGSVFGLAAADAVCRALSARSVGLEVAPGAPRVPIVPGACIYDLAGLSGAAPPDYGVLARAAAENAAAADGRDRLGAVGAGAGARAGREKGGVGQASIDLGEGLLVAALVVSNTYGSTRTPCGRAFWAWPFEIDREFGGERPDPSAPPASDPAPPDGKAPAHIGGHTAIGIVATTAALTGAEATRVAMMAQDGLARAVRPAHTLLDGDTLFALAAGAVALPEDGRRPHAVSRLGSAAADCVARSVARGVYASRGAA